MPEIIYQDIIYQWIDLVWLPIGYITVHKQHRIKTLAFILLCIFTMRSQISIMDSIGYGQNGIVSIMSSNLYERGLVAYGIIISIFLLLAHFSPATKPIVFLAIMLSIYISALCGTMILFAL